MRNVIGNRPAWWFYLLLPVFHFASVRLSFFCGVTPENEVVVWLPNAVLLAALLRFRGHRAWLMASLTFASDLVANLPEFPWPEAVLLCLVNLFEVASTFVLMARVGASAERAGVQDFVRFMAVGPLASALMAGLLAATILHAFDPGSGQLLTLARLWWFGDALGLLIYTPLLMALLRPADEAAPLNGVDIAVTLLTLGLAALIFSAHGGEIGGLPATPNLLLPSVLYLAVRRGVLTTALAVALISLATARVLCSGRDPFGGDAVYLAVMRVQEFILTLAVLGLGFSVLLRELKVTERSLEAKVRERTRALEESNAKLATLSTTDSLTGLANRRRFDAALADEWARALRTGQPLALALLDIDLFKNYNDCYGHQRGDECLAAVADIFASNIHRGGDLAARYGGEEFAFIAPATDAEGAWRMAETVREALVARGLPHDGSPFAIVTASLGVAVVTPTPGVTAEQLLKQADDALYRAKKAGRNRSVLASAGTAADGGLPDS